MDLGGILSRAGAAAQSYGEARTANLNRAAALEQLRRYRMETEELQNEINRQNIQRTGLAGLTIPALNSYDFASAPSVTVAAPPPPPPPPPPPSTAPTAPTVPTASAPAAPAPAAPAPAAPAPARVPTSGTVEEIEAIMRGNTPASVASTRPTPSPGTRIASAESQPSLLDQTTQNLIPEPIRNELERRQELQQARAAAAAAGLATATTAAPAAPAPQPAPAAALEPTSPPAGVTLRGATPDPVTTPLAAQPAAISLQNLERRNNLGLDARRIEEQYALLEQLASVYSQSGNSEALLSTIESMLGLQQQYDMAIGLSGLADLRRGDPRLMENFLTNMYGFTIDINPVVDANNMWTRNYQVMEGGTIINESISADELSSSIRAQFDDVFEQQQREAAISLQQAFAETQRELALIEARGSVDARLARQEGEIRERVAEIERSGRTDLQTFTTELGDTFVYLNGNIFRIVSDVTPGGGGSPGEPTIRFEPVTIPGT